MQISGEYIVRITLNIFIVAYAFNIFILDRVFVNGLFQAKIMHGFDRHILFNTIDYRITVLSSVGCE